MRRIILGAALLGVIGAAGVTTVAIWPVGAAPSPIALSGNVDRGAYLARASGCISCHSNFEAGGAALAGGAPLDTPFGKFYPPNLTTDPENGIGAWTVEQFSKAVRQGIGPDGKPYYPAFPYAFYADFSDQEIADLWAAFQTVPAVSVPAPEHDVGFPFNQRWGLKIWRAAFLYDPETEAVESRGDEWNRGRALVNGPAHCGACHTPRNLAGGREIQSRFTGNRDLPGGSNAPPITAEALEKKEWTVATLAYALESGLTPSGDAFGGSMAEVVRENTRFMTPEDRRAMATYLLSGDEGRQTN
ncbi:MAG: cytochrome c [Pseudomonadota bacterium]|nr:cytochrome c [Pseudomonadota bacterium]